MLSMGSIKQVVRNNIPYDTGFMYLNGVRFSEDATKYVIVYDGNAVPYIMFQEYGFKHWRSKKMITTNKGFIQNNTVNDLSFLINSASAKESTLIGKAQDRTELARQRTSREQMISQGTLQSIKGNKL